MIKRIQAELGKDQRLEPVEVLRAVIHLLVAHVSAGEIRDVVATLPESIRVLWHELMGPASDPSVHTVRREPVPRRTGYSR